MPLRDAGLPDGAAPDAWSPPPVSTQQGAGHWCLDNSLVFGCAWEDGTLEVGRSGQTPFVMERDLEDHDVVCIHGECDNTGPLLTSSPADAEQVTQTLFLNGGTCVRTSFSQLKISQGSQLDPSPVDLTWDLCLEPGSDELVVHLDASDEADYLDLAWLYFPYAPRLDDQGEGYAVLPMTHGFMLPVGWQVPMPQWSYTQDGGAVFHGRWNATGTYWGMPFFGVVEDDGRALLVEIRTEANASLRVHQVMGGAPRVTPAWHTSHSRFENGGTRTVVYVPLEGADYVDLALRYRASVLARGRHRSLTAKRAERPALEQLIGGTFVYATACYYDVNSEPPPYGTMYHRSTFAEVTDAIATAAQAGVAPLERGVIHLDGWGQRGYDNLHPDVVLSAADCVPAVDGSADCGPCDWAGGWSGLSDLVADLDPSWLLELHDNYRDFYLDAPSYGSDCPDCLLGWAGALSPPNDRWAGGPNHFLCASRALPYLQRTLAALDAHAAAPGAYYLDVFTAASADQCYSTEHRMAAAESLAHRATLLDALRGRGMVVASEQLVDWAVPYIDHVYWSSQARQFDPNSPDHRRQAGDSFFPSPIGIPLPLAELVYHDALLIPWPLLNGDREEVMLDAWLTAGVAQVPLEKLDDQRLRQEANRQRALHQAVGTQTMVDHSFTDQRYMSEQASWASGGSTSVDRDAWSVASAGIAGVEVGPYAPQVRRDLSVRVVSAEHAGVATLRLSLEWQTADDLGALPDQRVFLHAVRLDDGGIVANGDHDPPQATSSWVVGAPVSDGPVDLIFSEDGEFDVYAGLYHSGSDPARLDIITPRTNSALPLGRASVARGIDISLDARPVAHVRQVLARRAGDLEVELMTEWQVEQRLPPGHKIFLHALDGGGAIAANADYFPALPTEQWLPLARRREQRSEMSFDAGEVPGSYTIVTGMFDPSQGPAYPRIDFVGTDSGQRLVLGRLILDGVAGRIDAVRFCPAELEGCG